MSTVAAYVGGVGNASFTLNVSGAVARGPLSGDFPANRSHVLQLRGVEASGKKVHRVTCNGKDLAGFWHMSTDTTLAEAAGSLVVAPPEVSAFDSLMIEVDFL